MCSAQMDRDIHTMEIPWEMFWMACRFTFADAYSFPLETASRRNRAEGSTRYHARRLQISRGAVSTRLHRLQPSSQAQLRDTRCSNFVPRSTLMTFEATWDGDGSLQSSQLLWPICGGFWAATSTIREVPTCAATRRGAKQR